MGAVGLHGAAGAAHEPTERTRLSSIGWSKWAPVQMAALGAHAIGGAGLIAANRKRLKLQDEAAKNTMFKLGLTALAAGTTVYAGVLGGEVAKHASEGAKGATEPGSSSSAALAEAQSRLRVLQWVNPVLTGILVVMGAQQGEQQRSLETLPDRVR